MSAATIGGSSPSDVGGFDARYRPFVDFAVWGQHGGAQRDLWSRSAAELDGSRRLVTPQQVEHAVLIASRSAAIETGAIEGLYQVDAGFSMGIAQQSVGWEQALAEKGPAVRELFEAQLSAYELVLDSVIRGTPLSEALLRALHARICAAQRTYRVFTVLGWQDQTLPLGQYKAVPNHVVLADGSAHAYAPVDAVVPEMRRVMEQLRSRAFAAAHPIEQASYSHYALATVHPFSDGNGRVARALASVYFYRRPGIPFVVFAHQRPQYFAALEQADRGDTRAWLAFVADRGVDAMQLVIQTLQAAAAQRPAEIAEDRESKRWLAPS